MEILVATERDCQILTQLFSVLYKAETKWSEEKIKKNIVQQRKEYYLGFVDNQPEAALSLKFNTEDCELEAIVARTKKQGNGSRLLRFAEDLVRKRGCSKIWCYSLECYKVGNFYKKNGWIEEEFIQDFWDEKNSFKYSKQLNKSNN